jgi:hypothetical protein
MSIRVQRFQAHMAPHNVAKPLQKELCIRRFRHMISTDDALVEATIGAAIGGGCHDASVATARVDPGVGFRARFRASGQSGSWERCKNMVRYDRSIDGIFVMKQKSHGIERECKSANISESGDCEMRSYRYKIRSPSLTII